MLQHLCRHGFSSVFLKRSSDLMSLCVPQLDRRSRNVDRLQVVPLVTGRLKIWLGCNHRVIGILREYWWGEKDRGESCWRHRIVSSAEQFSFSFKENKKTPQFLFYMLYPIVCSGLKVHSRCEHAEARAGSILFYRFLSRTLGLTSFQLPAKSGSWVKGQT